MSAIVIDQRLVGIPRPFSKQPAEADERLVQKGLTPRRRLMKLGIGVLIVALLLAVVWVKPVLSRLVT
jgi:type II secretory pathway component PulM